MTRAAIALCLFFAAIAVAAVVGQLAIAAADRAIRSTRWPQLGARTRASLLAQARLAPATLGLLFAVLVQAAFWAFEPDGRPESVGIVLMTLALAGVALSVVVAVRTWRSARATRQLAAAWRSIGVERPVEGWNGRAWLVDTPFPVVAVIGVRQAELFVSADVIRSCSRRELAAVAAHERAHVTGRDNLTRWLVAVTPAVGAARRLEETWEAAAEELADLTARAGGNGVTLARALLKVARLADRHPDRPTLAISAFIGGGNLDARVRRLLEPPRAAGRALQGPSLVFNTALVAAGAAWGLPAIYEAAEALVRLGR